MPRQNCNSMAVFAVTVYSVFTNKQNGDLQIGKRLVNDIDRVKYTYMTSSCNHNRFVFGYRKEENTDDNPILQILHLKN